MTDKKFEDYQSRIDRCAAKRTDEAYQAEIRKRPATRLVPVWRGRCLLCADGAHAHLPTVAEAGELVKQAEAIVFLGELDGQALLMLDLPRGAEPQLPKGTAFVDLRLGGMALDASDFALLAYARGMAHWHRTEQFDGKTGARSGIVDGGFARQTNEGDKLFPRTDPAVMMLVTRGDACLLARQARFPTGMYSALAGFVEPGESLEDRVVRETFEEVGLRVERPRYVASQPWPFPRSLMVGFRATSESGDVQLDEEELSEARWFTRDELKKPDGFFFPPVYSLANRMIRGFIDDTD